MEKRPTYLADRKQIKNLSVITVLHGDILKTTPVDSHITETIIEMKPDDSFDEAFDIHINECGGFYLGSVQIRIKDGKITTEVI